MATDLATPSNTLAKVRFEEPYVSDGLNKKFNGIVPAGVIRGGKLTTNALAMNVTIEDDSVTGDSVYSFINSDGHQLTFRQQGNVSLDLTAVASTVVYIGLEIGYGVSSTTTVKWRAFSLAEVQADPTIVVLGRVDVPASGVIPAANITDDLRASAWMNTSQYMRDAVQVIENGDFRLAKEGAVYSNLMPHWGARTLGGSATLSIIDDALTAKSGRYYARITLPGNASQAVTFAHNGFFAIKGGSLIKVGFWLGTTSLTPGPGSSGHMGIKVDVYNDGPDDLIETFYAEDLTISGTTAFTRIEEIFRVDAAANWVRISLYYDDDNQSSTGNVLFDDIKLFIEQPHTSDGDQSRLAALSDSAGVFNSLYIPKPVGEAADLDEYIEDMLGLKWSSGETWNLARDNGTFDYILNLLGGSLQKSMNGDNFQLVYTAPGQLFAPDLRVYQGDVGIGGTDHISFVINASESSGVWSRDVSGHDSILFEVSVSGINVYKYESSDADGWSNAEWSSVGTQLLQLNEATGILKSAALTADGTLDVTGVLTANEDTNLEKSTVLGDSIDSTSVLRALPRLDTKVNGSASYTCLMKLESTTGDDDIFLYAVYDADAAIFSSRTHFCIVNNAEWNGTTEQWSRVDSSSSSYRYDFTPYGYFGYAKVNTATSPWDDVDWQESGSHAAVEVLTRFTGSDPWSDVRFKNGRIVLGDGATSITNPSATSSIDINALYSKNNIKTWARFKTVGNSGTSIDITLLNGFNIDNVVEVSANVIRVDFKTALDSKDDCCYLFFTDTDEDNCFAQGSYSLSSAGGAAAILVDSTWGPRNLRTNGETHYWNFVALGEKT